MTEYLNKRSLLEWLEQEIRDESWIGESAERGMRTVRNFILSGSFDIDESECTREIECPFCGCEIRIEPKGDENDA